MEQVIGPHKNRQGSVKNLLVKCILHKCMVSPEASKTPFT